MNVDFGNAWKNGSRMIDGAISLLPNVFLAAIVFVLFMIVASLARRLIRRFLERQQRRHNVALLLSKLVHLVVLILGFLIALAIVAPSFRAGDLVKMLGIGSVAIGFAFQNILQNFLAGILLLLQEPFALGDWITVASEQGKLEGRVQDIQARATVVSTLDGQRAIIPNALLFTQAVVVGKPNAAPDAKAPA
jgi:small conductance mechanosensitive channel